MLDNIFRLTLVYGDTNLFFLRLILGLILIVHGWPKIKNLRGTADNFTAMGFKPGVFWGTIVAIVEFFGGLTIVAGFLANFALVLVVAEFFVINAWKIVKKQPFVGGLEFDFLILASALTLLSFGSGAWSLDQFIFSRFLP